MNRDSSSWLVLLVSLTVLLVGCTAKESASNTTAKPASASSNASPADNSNQQARDANANGNPSTSKEGDPSAPAKASPAQLVGTYEAREIQDKGVVTLVTKIKTIISFSSEGTYSRASQAAGKIYHSDSGQFHIVAPDRLVLTIQMSGEKANRKIQNPPLSKTHKFSLSPDGDELRLTSEKGATAIFKRVGKPRVS